MILNKKLLSQELKHLEVKFGKIKKECNLHFTLSIKKNVDFSSSIIIDTICNKNNELNNLHNDILKAIHDGESDIVVGKYLPTKLVKLA